MQIHLSFQFQVQFFHVQTRIEYNLKLYQAVAFKLSRLGLETQ